MKFKVVPLLCLSLMLFAACGSKKPVGPIPTDGGRSAVLSIDALMKDSAKLNPNRSAALLGIFVSEYISISGIATAVQGGLTAIEIDRHILQSRTTVTDPDFDLLQAFADALQVDVADLLNRSTDRQQTLDTYTTALTNVATKANDRYKQLTASLTEINATLRTQKNELSAAQRSLQTAIRDKEFSDAGIQQKTVNEKQAAVAETELKKTQTEDVVDTLDQLLTLYGEKILAIQQNREVLIAGNSVVDVPGAEELQVIRRQKSRSGSSGKKATKYDLLFPQE